MRTFIPRANFRFWLSADLRDHASLVPLSGGKRTFELDVCFRADCVRFRPGSGRSRGPCPTSAADPKVLARHTTPPRRQRAPPFGCVVHLHNPLRFQFVVRPTLLKIRSALPRLAHGPQQDRPLGTGNRAGDHVPSASASSGTACSRRRVVAPVRARYAPAVRESFFGSRGLQRIC